jgi:hypothetical protein
MDIKTIGTRKTSSYQQKYVKQDDGRAGLVNTLVVNEGRQAIMNDEEAKWLLKHFKKLEWKEHPEGDLATIFDGMRYRVTKAQKAAYSGSKAVVEAPKPEESELPRAEVQDIAKSYGINSNQKTKVLLKLIKVADKNEKSETS